jgi:hypothetical protein
MRGDVSGVCMIVEADSLEAVIEKLITLSLVQAGFLKPPTVISLKPYMAFGSR